MNLSQHDLTIVLAVRSRAFGIFLYGSTLWFLRNGQRIVSGTKEN